MKKLLGITLLSVGLMTTSLIADEVKKGEGLYKTCAGCHGIMGDKKALGKSKIIKDMSETELATALKGYKDGTYGGPMKGVMKSQVMNKTDEDLKALVKYIATLSPKEEKIETPESQAPKKPLVKQETPKEDKTVLIKKGQGLYNSCIGCHGNKGQNVALGKSKIIKDMSESDILTALKGYKDGTYGGVMKGAMKGQVMTKTEEDLKALAAYIATLK